MNNWAVISTWNMSYEGLKTSADLLKKVQMPKTQLKN